MQHPYNKLEEQSKKQFQWKIILLIIGIVVFSGILIYFTKSFLPFILIFIGINTLASFIDVPQGIKKGNLVRYSPMFLTSKERKQHIQLHGGTLFDYYFCLPEYKTASERKKAVLLAYLEGLVNVIETKKDSPETKVLGTTYILNPRTAEKLGFKVTPPQIGQKFLLVMNYIPILIAHSLLHKKLSFPKLSNSIGIAAEISELQQNKKRIEQLVEKLKKADL
ncbi:hypothetical protein GCM10010832_11070 [Psychroflexus planctonicus]|uniref:DUF2892 domain-containing protein n=1 Tax=Psychroflexus planctonicus TaxID=1526575 RepID=A0ABQ1SEG9_9FLAO|nr:hypothetical protein GCM10010832_11070 [Psychroflexus planctonicus]